MTIPRKPAAVAGLERALREARAMYTCGCPADQVRDIGHQEGCAVQIVESERDAARARVAELETENAAQRATEEARLSQRIALLVSARVSQLEVAAQDLTRALREEEWVQNGGGTTATRAALDALEASL